MLLELLAAVGGFAIASMFLPLVIRWARQQSVLDYPDDIRRRHASPTPRLGGVAIFTAVALAGMIGLVQGGTPGIPSIWPGLLLGASIVFVIGVIDDIRGVLPIMKLIGHSTAAAVVIAYGFSVEAITLGGGLTIHLGYFAVPVTIFWIVGITNAFNLIDGVDGLASTFALIGLITVVVVEIMVKPTPQLIISAAAIGSLFAFMRYNRNPAKIFLGDSGSTTLGFFLSIQLAMSATGVNGETYALVPIFALAYPLTDTGVAIARRWLRGHPLSRADGRHIHHQLLALGMSPRRTVDLLGLLFSAVAVMGVSIVFAPPRVTFALATGGTIFAFTALVYGVRWLGYHEFSEFATSIVSVALNARSHVRKKIRASDLAVKLKGAESLDDLKQILGDGAEELGLLELTLDTHAGHLQGPSHRRLGPKNVRPLRVECPIVWEVPGAQGQVREATLRFWCDRPGVYTHLGVERLATRIAPAVQTWFEVNAHRIPPEMRERPAERRRSGGYPVISSEYESTPTG
jgi:UDP-GlcNAc:undecaprenyl-phosphate/decaprenyl-phosphate GlcNAc-1-phosphate transferase